MEGERERETIVGLYPMMKSAPNLSCKTNPTKPMWENNIIYMWELMLMEHGKTHLNHQCGLSHKVNSKIVFIVAQLFSKMFIYPFPKFTKLHFRSNVK